MLSGSGIRSPPTADNPLVDNDTGQLGSGVDDCNEPPGSARRRPWAWLLRHVWQAEQSATASLPKPSHGQQSWWGSADMVYLTLGIADSLQSNAVTPRPPLRASLTCTSTRLERVQEPEATLFAGRIRRGKFLSARNGPSTRHCRKSPCVSIDLGCKCNPPTSEASRLAARRHLRNRVPTTPTRGIGLHR